MKVTRIRAGVFRLELKPDEELELHAIASETENTVEETVQQIIDEGIEKSPLTDD